MYIFSIALLINIHSHVWPQRKNFESQYKGLCLWKKLISVQLQFFKLVEIKLTISHKVGTLKTLVD